MKVSKMRFACVCLVCLTQVIWSPLANAAVTESFGTFVIEINLTVSTPVPAGGVVSCNGTVSVTGDTNGSYFETAGALATHGSGATWTCIMPIPFAWFLSNQTTDMITVNYSADIFTVFTVGAQAKVVSIRNTTYTAPPTTGVPTVNNSTTVRSFAAKL